MKKNVQSSIVAGAVFGLLVCTLDLFGQAVDSRAVHSFVFGIVFGAFAPLMFRHPRVLGSLKFLSAKYFYSLALLAITAGVTTIVIGVFLELSGSLVIKNQDFSFGWMVLGLLFGNVALFVSKVIILATRRHRLVKELKEERDLLVIKLPLFGIYFFDHPEHPYLVQMRERLAVIEARMAELK